MSSPSTLIQSLDGKFTDLSSSITLGGTVQTIQAEVAQRRYFFFQNVSDTDMWINFGSVDALADSPAIRITPTSSFVLEASACSREKITVYCATTGKKYTCKTL